MVKKKKDKPKAKKPKIDLLAGMSQPDPVNLGGPQEILEKAREYPFLGCWVMEGWQAVGLVPVVVARLPAPDQVIYGSFVVDIFCLGVKNANWNAGLGLKQFYAELPRLCADRPLECPPDLAHEIIYGAIEFARKYGFEPHPDFSDARQVLDPPEMHSSRQRVEFGRGGKPFYIPGPYDNVKAILEKLERTAGPGNYDYFQPF
jgi:hypothetical protein